MEDYLISVAATLILRALEDGDKRSKYRRILLKLFRAIGSALADDPELRNLVKLMRAG